MRYKNTVKEKKNGVVYTPSAMADYLANEMFRYKQNDNCGIVRVLDPAVGQGELLIAIIKAIKQKLFYLIQKLIKSGR